MPSVQMIDINPNPRSELTPLESTLRGFSKRHRENQVDQQESDALRDIYSQYQQDGNNLQRTIQEVQSDARLSPTTRVNTIDQLLKFQKHNQTLQKQARTEASNRAKVADLEKRRNLPPGTLDAYQDDRLWRS